MPDYAVVEMGDLEDNDEDLARAWNQDGELSALGTAQNAGDRTAAFPLDPASLGAAFLISVAAGVATEALVAGVKALLARSRPESSFDVEVHHSGSSGDVVRVRVTQRR